MLQQREKWRSAFCCCCSSPASVGGKLCCCCSAATLEANLEANNAFFAFLSFYFFYYLFKCMFWYIIQINATSAGHSGCTAPARGLFSLLLPSAVASSFLRIKSFFFRNINFNKLICLSFAHLLNVCILYLLLTHRSEQRCLRAPPTRQQRADLLKQKALLWFKEQLKHFNLTFLFYIKQEKDVNAFQKPWLQLESPAGDLGGP